MKLLYPEFLWALTALSIPIIIHLFNFRKFTKVYFSNIELLKEVKLETKSKSRLKHLLILLIRLLLVTLLVIAFAQPYIPVEDEIQLGDASVGVYIDNSYSMDTKGENGYLLDLAKEQAIRIAESYKATDRFQVITNDSLSLSLSLCLLSSRLRVFSSPSARPDPCFHLHDGSDPIYKRTPM